MASTELIESVEIPANMRKMTTLEAARFYDKIKIYANRAIGYIKGMQSQTWFFKDFNGIEVIHANMNSQFAQVVFQTAVNAKSKFVDLDFGAMQNRNAMQDANRILFCAGMFSFGASNEYADSIAAKIRRVIEKYKNEEDEQQEAGGISVAVEIKKFKELLDQGIITQEEFDAKKKQLLGL